MPHGRGGPVFDAFSFTPGQFDLAVEADGETNDDTISFMPADLAVSQVSVFRTPVRSVNPTGTWRVAATGRVAWRARRNAVLRA
ncbi:hypothetical protein K8I61_14220 [bacterium]|nr:hypothetical protein [bacterium]